MLGYCNVLLLICFMKMISCQQDYKFSRTDGTAIAGHNDAVWSTDIDNCPKLCASETSFECLSADYITSTNECKLSKSKRGQPGVEMVD